MTDIILLTGFLGSGKTTLMKSLLTEYDGKKIGVISNEFGEINIDGELLRRDGITMTELSNGSIFCACIKANFINALIDMASLGLDHIFVESSGLADPSNMGQIIDSINDKRSASLRLAGSICVVDAAHFTGMAKMLPALERQVFYAGAVIINRSDMAGTEKVKETASLIEEMNPDASIFVTSFCRVEMDALVSSLKPSDREPDETTNTVSTRASTFAARADCRISRTGLEAFLKDTASGCYRIKGFADTDEGVLEVSAVMEDITISPWGQPIDGTQIVLISSIGMKMLSVIVKSSAEHLGGALQI